MLIYLVWFIADLSSITIEGIKRVEVIHLVSDSNICHNQVTVKKSITIVSIMVSTVSLNVIGGAFLIIGIFILL